MAPQRSAETLFVDSQLGELPLLLTCPHDGRGAPPGLEPRSDPPEPGCGRVRTDADLFTRQITLGLSAAVEDLTALPFSVIARFRRRFIDANREAKCAFDSKTAKAARPFYDEYHRRITLGIAAIKRTFPNRGLLVDIHGARDQADPEIHVLLGTDNGKSLKRLLALDPMILWRRGGPVRRLQAAGFGVVPAEAGGMENSSFDGGFTVRSHGAERASGLDALQVEIVFNVRDNDDLRKQLIEALAAGLVSVLRRQARLVEAQG
jgi:N-formylglutamate amidohydrolase